MRERYCKVCGGWHQPDAWPHTCIPGPISTRSDHPAPGIVNDTMEPTRSMVDGKLYTSKAALRATYKPGGNREGKRYAEVGNDASVTDPKPFQKPKPDRQAIKASVATAFSQAGLGA